MKIHEIRLKGHVLIGGFRSTGNKKDPSIGGDNCEIIDIVRINQRKLDIKCKYVVNNNEQSQTIKALTKQGEGVLDFMEKNKMSLIGKKVSDIYNLEVV
ncbi:MAG: hypothetical protein Q8R12_00125 [bacterium]|nr:hypothetical protein [bacterium]